MKNIKKEKGFTLIELLVVVAIIGILAAVGVVAYNGYTASAKKGAAASNHASVVKYIAAETAKCGIESVVMEGKEVGADGSVSDTSLTCTNKGTATATKAAAALSDFKNPDTGVIGVLVGTKATAIASPFSTMIEQTSTTEVTVFTCTETEELVADTVTCKTGEMKQNVISIQ